MTFERSLITSSARCAAAAFGFLLLVPVTAGAEDMARQGEFRITYTAINPAVPKPVSIGNNRSASAMILTMTAVNEAGSGLLHNMAGRCSSSPLVDSGAKTFENHGYCDYVDADGDHVYEKWDYPVQSMAAVSEGTGAWIGGTGKFAGLTGTMTIRSRRLNSPVDGATQVVGEKRGSYSLTDTVASAKPD
ncbi:hypothetical protein MKK69_00565 [Methylobacterium sp. J-026]|uniref:hypothetical protein n=1 Tax=Methylobacterium sp. J-026 TaxID=2836624 RepID=UPI001FBAAA96|nr:hypothetical protein [Methylobacterium sp. J-026]MCJ2132576.1 hypothetical protein [Methylobacterium sp. J-026]